MEKELLRIGLTHQNAIVEAITPHLQMFLSLWDEGEKAPGSFSSLTDIHVVDVFDNAQWSLKGIWDRSRFQGKGGVGAKEVRTQQFHGLRSISACSDDATGF